LPAGNPAELFAIGIVQSGFPCRPLRAVSPKLRRLIAIDNRQVYGASLFYHI
jgi:hypothetical protein